MNKGRSVNILSFICIPVLGLSNIQNEDMLTAIIDEMQPDLQRSS